MSRRGRYGIGDEVANTRRETLIGKSSSIKRALSQPKTSSGGESPKQYDNVSI